VREKSQALFVLIIRIFEGGHLETFTVGMLIYYGRFP
jgi:hypothetical protein